MSPANSSIQLPGTAWTGLFDAYGQLVRPCTEAPEAFHLGSFITVAGCLVGRTAWVCNPHPIYPNFYTLLVGKTGLARKTTAYRFGVDLLRDGAALLNVDAKLLHGLASIEGLAAAMSHPDPATSNRILCVQDEFKSLAMKNKQKAVSNLIQG